MKKSIRLLVSCSLVLLLLFGAASNSLAYQNSTTTSMYGTAKTTVSMYPTKLAVPVVPAVSTDPSGSVTAPSTGTSPTAPLIKKTGSTSSMYGTVKTSVSMNPGKPVIPAVPTVPVTVPAAGTSSPAPVTPQPADTAQQNLQAAMARAADPNNHPTPEEQKLIDMVNSTRVSMGLKPLQVDMRLVETARLKAADMAEYNYFGHYSTLYGAPSDMAAAAGLPFWIGENVSQGTSVDSIFTGFLNSPPHRENLLRPSYTKTGVGIVKVNGITILVQHFAE